jgi:dienelactone hydrolase
MKTKLLLFAALGLFASACAWSAAFHNPYGKLSPNATPGDRMFADYFRAETETLARRSLSDLTSLDEWKRRKPELRRQLFEMLGLDPLPPKTDLRATITGKIDQPDFVVEKLHFQSRPGLYVTANLYLPKNLTSPAPAILYGCGHSVVKSNNVSYGNKVDYQHHGIWFARHGYVCLMLDTVQLGEIGGIHHGTYRENMWWWNSRGYTSAGAEAWNCIRALDYLETRPEVDKTRFGVTGRSGGGAYSWWISALDERIQAACPVAGITDLENHIVDGTVEGHCDCMFMVNTYRWDFAQVAAMVAPRPLLICNTDKDTIFPLDGVTRLHEKARRVYDLYGASDKLGLLITEGPHEDTQELQVPVFRWFNRFLKKEKPLVEEAAKPLFSGQQLKVFDQLPADEITSRCFENFTRLAANSDAFDPKWALEDLRVKTFGGWPEVKAPPAPRELMEMDHDGVRLAVYEFESQPGVTLRFYLARPANEHAASIHLEIADEAVWRQKLEIARAGFSRVLNEEFSRAGIDPNRAGSDSERELAGWTSHIRDNKIAWVAFTPRGVGITALSNDPKYLIQVRRRFMLLGQTWAGMQVWDARRAIQAARQVDGLGKLPLEFGATPEMTEIALFAGLFEPGVSSMVLLREPRGDKEAPDFLNWSRIVTPNQLMSLARQRFDVVVNSEP